MKNSIQNTENGCQNRWNSNSDISGKAGNFPMAFAVQKTCDLLNLADAFRSFKKT